MPGAFESSACGTLFLDEVGECDQETPAKLLRVLPSPSGAGSGFRTIRRVGDYREIPVDVRVTAATNRDLYETISAGTFREDLFDRLTVFSITLPPLRERRSDIPHLSCSFDCGQKINRCGLGLKQTSNFIAIVETHNDFIAGEFRTDISLVVCL